MTYPNTPASPDRINIQFKVTGKYGRHTTTVYVWIPEEINLAFAGGEWCSGFAKCRKGDVPNKHLARRLALDRALQLAHIARDDRRDIWDYYFKIYEPAPKAPYVDIVLSRGFAEDSQGRVVSDGNHLFAEDSRGRVVSIGNYLKREDGVDVLRIPDPRRK